MPFRFVFKGGGGVSLKIEGSEGSCHSDSASMVRVGSIKQNVVRVVRVEGRSESVKSARNKLKTINLV